MLSDVPSTLAPLAARIGADDCPRPSLRTANSMIGPGGERWLSVHGLVPHSQARVAYQAVLALFERNTAILESRWIVHGALFTYADTDCFVIERVFYWPDRLNALHWKSVEAFVLRHTDAYPDNPAARAQVMRLRG